ASNVVAGGPVHQLAAMAVETNIDLRTTVFVVAGLGVSDRVTSDDQLTLKLYRWTPFLAEAKGLGSGTRRIEFSLQAELQVGSLAENSLGLSGVLHTRQLDHDTIGALTLHQRLSHTQLVNAVAHGGQVLTDRVFANLADLRRSQCQLQHFLPT